MTPYEVLGVRPDASAVEIRQAFLALARRHHPDRLLGASPAERVESEQRMRAVNEAWAVLGDPERRRHLDADRPTTFQPFDPADDDPDPRQVPDVPYRPAPAPSAGQRTATLAPVLLFAGSIGVGAAGAVIRVSALFGLAALLFVLSCVGFLVLPLLALGRARQDEG